VQTEGRGGAQVNIAVIINGNAKHLTNLACRYRRALWFIPPMSTLWRLSWRADVENAAGGSLGIDHRLTITLDRSRKPGEEGFAWLNGLGILCKGRGDTVQLNKKERQERE
jgi:hypothetical protein